MADLAVFAVDVADLAFDVFAHLDVALDALPARRRELHQNGVVALGPILGEQLRKRPQPNVNALGVVQPVDAEQDLARVAELAADLARPAAGSRELRACWSSAVESIEIGNAPTLTVRKPTSTSPNLERTPTDRA